MGQNQYADWFINAMLGWIRFIANGIASMFQTSSARMSSGNAILNWFSSNWITLLLSMIVIGIAVDWLVWMVRWRPYWLWFRKKRILLDDDIDLDLNDEELMRRYAPRAPRQDAHPHFKGSNLGRAKRPAAEDTLYDGNAYDEAYDAYDEFGAPDIEDPYDGEDAYESYEDEDDDYDDAPALRRTDSPYQSDDDYEDDERFDELYDDEDEYDEDDEDEGDYGESDAEEPDISFLSSEDERDGAYLQPAEKPRRAWFSGLRRTKTPPDDDDPFSVDDAALDDPDDDFFSLVSDLSPLPAQSDDREQDTSVYKHRRPLDTEFADELSGEPKDWKTGYSAELPSVEADASRKSRRQRREHQDE